MFSIQKIYLHSEIEPSSSKISTTFTNSQKFPKLTNSSNLEKTLNGREIFRGIDQKKGLSFILLTKIRRCSYRVKQFGRRLFQNHFHLLNIFTKYFGTTRLFQNHLHLLNIFTKYFGTTRLFQHLLHLLKSIMNYFGTLTAQYHSCWYFKGKQKYYQQKHFSPNFRRFES